MWTTDLGDASAALRSAEISLEELGIGSVDLVMVHWPMPGKHVEAYVALEELVRSGRAKGLGASQGVEMRHHIYIYSRRLIDRYTYIYIYFFIMIYIYISRDDAIVIR